MKRAIIKSVFVLTCILIIIFLLLPFLQTNPPATTDLKSAQPQIAFSNPLITIAKRLASLFKRKPKEGSHPLAQPVPAAPANSSYPSDMFYALRPMSSSTASSSAQEPTSSQHIPVSQVPTDYGNATIQTDEGQWVLIRQVVPLNGAAGMHEINIHENSYDKYVKQERARAFGRTPQKTQIPDSKWARFTEPFKKLFGVDSDQKPLENSPISISQEQDKVNLLASTKDKRAESKIPMPSNRQTPSLINITPNQWARMSEEEREQANERQAITQFMDLISGEKTAREAAQIMADARIPAPKNPKEEKEKQSLIEKLTEENKQRIRAGLLQAMQENQEGKPDINQMEMLFTCSTSSLPKNYCSASAQKPLSPEEVETQKALNAQAFYEKTHFVLPKGTPVTVVLGPASPEAIATLEADPQTQDQQAQKYKFLYEYQGCDKKPCFWVNNSIQKSDDELTTTFGLADMKLKGDPNQVYKTLEGPLQQYLQNQPANQTDPGDPFSQQPQAPAQVSNEKLPWIPYTAEQIKEMQQNTFSVVTAEGAQTDWSKATIPFAGTANDALRLAEVIGPYILYHEGSLSDAPNIIEAGKQVNDSAANNVSTATDVSGKILSEAAQENAGAMVNMVNQAISKNNKRGGSVADLINMLKNYIPGQKKETK